MAKQYNITHVIWDFDGVLIDSEQVYSDVNSYMMARYNKQFTLDMKLSMMGTKKDEAVKILLKSAGLEATVDPIEYTKHYDEQLNVALTDCAELAGASKLIDYFCAIKLPQAICTGSTTEEFRLKTDKRYMRWLQQISLRVMSGDDPEVARGKPAPDPYIVTMARFAQPPASPSNVLVFEDSLNGARSAIAAGCNCIMIPQHQFLNDAGRADLELLRPQLAEEIKSLEEFDPVKYSLPAFK